MKKKNATNSNSYSSKEALRRQRQEMAAAAAAAAADATMQAAMRQLPLELTSAYHEARLRVPQIVEKESNPHWFLRYAQA
jgi:hypothetical protein